MPRVYHKNVTKENMPTNQAIEPEKEEKERKEDQTDHRRNQRIPSDVSSEKDKGKAPMSSTDPSADEVFDEDPARKIHKQLTKDKGKAPMSSTDPSADEVFDEDPARKIHKQLTKDKGKAPMSSTDPSADEVFDEDPARKIHKQLTKDKGKAPMSSTDPSADEVFDEDPTRKIHKQLLNYARQRLLGKEPEVPGLVETSKEMDAKVPKTPKKTNNFKIRTRKRQNLVLMDVKRDDMFSSLRGLTEVQMDAICALYRHMTSEDSNRTFSDSQHAKVYFVVEFLTGGNVFGPRIRTAEELEESYKGSVALCSYILSIYSSELYDIYYVGMDPDFRYTP